MVSARLIVVRVLIPAAVVVGVAVFFCPCMCGASPRNKTACISNLKQIVVASLAYAETHDGRLPTESWQEDLLPYTKNNDLYSCPKLADEKLKWGYAMTYEHLSSQLSQIQDPHLEPLYFEVDALAKDVVANIEARSLTRHASGSSIARADGSARYFRATASIRGERL